MILSLLKNRLRDKPSAKVRPASGRTSERKTWLDVNGAQVPVIIVENPRSKRLTLRIMPGGKELRLSAPPKTPYREIDRFLQKHKNWATSRLAKMPKVQKLSNGATIQLRGIPHLIVHRGSSRGLAKTAEVDGQWQLHVNGNIEHLPRRVVDFLRKQARADLASAVRHHSANLGVRAKSVSLRDTTTRWGSCSSKGTLSFSWRIILAPPDVLDYLAAHEVAHLREMNHSPRFWKLVEETCPHTYTSRAWLKTHGASLHALIID